MSNGIGKLMANSNVATTKVVSKRAQFKVVLFCDAIL